MVVLVDGAAHGAQTIVAVGQHIRYGKLRHTAGLGGLDDAHIGDVVGDQAVEGQVQQAVPRRSVVAAEDPVGHGLFAARRVGGLGRGGNAAPQGDAAVMQLDHMVTLLLGEILQGHFLWVTV